MTFYSFPLNGAALGNRSIDASTSSPATGLRRELDRLMSEVFGAPHAEGSGQPGTFRPATDAVEDATSFTLTLDLPGVPADKLEVLAEEGVLTIKGERARAALPREEARALFAERVEGRFERRFRLPKTADASAIEAMAADGVLSVRIAKVAPTQPRRVTVNVAQPQVASAVQASEKSEA